MKRWAPGMRMKGPRDTVGCDGGKTERTDAALPNFRQLPGRGRMMAERKEEEQGCLGEIKGALIKGLSLLFFDRSGGSGGAIQWQ